MLRSLLYTISQIISVYSFLCLVRILMSWVPQIAYSSFGQMLASLCDPYLNWFRRFRFTQIGMLDFSPILALGVLSIASDMCSTIIRTGSFSLWHVFIGIIQVVWSFISFVCNLLIIFLLVRLVYDLSGSSGSSPFWYQLDRFLNPCIAKTTTVFPFTQKMGYRGRLIWTMLLVIAVRIALGLLIGSLSVGFYAARVI